MDKPQRMKNIYSLSGEEPEPITGQKSFEDLMAATRKHWQTSGRRDESGMRRRKKSLADGTMTVTGYCLRSVMRKMGGIELTQEWIDSAAEKLKIAGLDERTINNYMLSIDRVFQANGADVIVPQFEETFVEHYHYSISEAEKLIRFGRKEPSKAILGFLYFQGPRVGELCNVNMEHLDMGARRVKLYGQKTRKWRTIPLNPKLLPYLTPWLEMREKIVRVLQNSGGQVPNALFLNQCGRRVTEKGVEKLVERTAKKAGFEGKALEEAHPHTLRHSIANHLLHEYNPKWDIPSVAYFLGDSIDTVEKYYAHTNVENCERNMARMF
jgi:integrase